MPYSTVSELPANIKKLPAKKQRQWMHIFNSAMKKHGKEATAFKMANSVVGSNAEYVASEAIDDYVGGYELDEHRLTQQEAEYTPISTKGDQACANCQWFVSPNTCCVVRGEISPTGWSNHWEAEVDNVPDPIPVQIVGPDNQPLAIKLTTSEYKPGDKFVLNANGELVLETVIVQATTNTSNDWSTHFGGLLRKAGQSLGIGTSKVSNAEFTLYKIADDTLKFMAWWSNCFQDNASITIPIAAQKDVVSWADSIQEYPKVLLWHAPLTEFAQVEMLDFVDGFNVAFGSILPGKEDVAYRLAEYEGGIGCSHGSLYETEGDSILRIRPFEITALPSNRARNSWTHFLAGNWEEAMGFTDEKKKFLKDIGGLTDEQISASENATVAMTAALKKNGIAWADDSPPDLVGIQDSITKLAEGVATLAASIQEQQAAIEPIKAEVAELKANKTTLDEQVANELASASRQCGHVASQADDNIVSSSQVNKDKDKVFSIFEEVKAGLSAMPAAQ